MAQPNHRKTYLINPRVQWRFIGFMAAVSLLAIFMLRRKGKGSSGVREGALC